MNPNTAIQNIMTKAPVRCKPNDSLLSIRKIFKENNFHHIPVIDNQENLLGIISRSDYSKVIYIMSEASGKERFALLQAEDIMTKYPLHLDPEDTIGLAADIFLANKFHALPITENGKLAGIMTSHDLIAYCFKAPVEVNHEIESYEED